MSHPTRPVKTAGARGPGDPDHSSAAADAGLSQARRGHSGLAAGLLVGRRGLALTGGEPSHGDRRHGEVGPGGLWSTWRPLRARDDGRAYRCRKTRKMGRVFPVLPDQYACLSSRARSGVAELAQLAALEAARRWESGWRMPSLCRHRLGLHRVMPRSPARRAQDLHNAPRAAGA
jgi:hypothetical protein